MPLVIDANIAIAWFRPAASAFADAVLGVLLEHDAIVPALWRWEVQDVLRRLDSDGQLTMAADAALNELLQLPITVDDRPLRLFGEAMPLARKHGLTVYDAAYLDVALRHDIQLATLDKKLAAAAKRSGAAFTFSGPVH
jgi:predicted nucleic acid-binding protein